MTLNLPLHLPQRLAIACVMLALAPSLAQAWDLISPSARSELGITGYGYINSVLMGRSSGLATARANLNIAPSGLRVSRWSYEAQFDTIASTYLGGSASERSFWLEVPEFSVSLRAGSSQLYLGRHREQWSELDDEWSLGLWQSRERWDYLQVRPVGLTGLFWDLKASPDLSMTLFGSPLFVPERGPEIALRDGVFYPSNAWPGSPPSRTVIGGVQTDIRYSIQMPSLSKILLNPSIGSKVRWGARPGASGLWASAAYAFKPVNQVVLAYEGTINLDAGTADAVIHPRIAYHHLAEAALGSRVGRWSWNVSTLREVPVLDEASPSWTTQVIAPSWVTGGTTRWRSRSGWELGAGYLRRFGPTAADQGPQAGSGASVFEPRILFEEAVSGTLRIGIPGVSMDQFSIQTRMVQALKTGGTLLSPQLSFRPRANWSLTAGADLLGSEATPGSGPDFISRFRAHDRYYGGLSYVF